MKQQRVIDGTWWKGPVYGLAAGAISGAMCGLPFFIVGALYGAVIGAVVGFVLGIVLTAIIQGLSYIQRFTRETFVVVAYVTTTTLACLPFVIGLVSMFGVPGDDWFPMLFWYGVPTIAGVISAICGTRYLTNVDGADKRTNNL